MSEVRVWGCGSRGLTNPLLVELKMAEYSNPQTDAYRTGGARGADTLITEWVMQELALLRPPIIPKWDKYGKGAGKKRNTEGVEWCTKVVAFWDGESPGTEHVIDEAMRLRKELIIIYY